MTAMPCWTSTAVPATRRCGCGPTSCCSWTGATRGDRRGRLFTSSSTIARWQRRFRRDGFEAVFGAPRGRRQRLASWWAAMVVGWVLRHSPRDFGFLRSRWSCAAAAVVVTEGHGVAVSRETVRRWLRDEGLVWRRPRPALRPRDPDREPKLRACAACWPACPTTRPRSSRTRST